MKIKYIIIHFVITFFSHNFLFSAEKTLVNIDRIITEIDDATPCDLDKWANKLNSACKCCLIKRVPYLGINKTATQILEECLNKKQCTREAFEAIQKELQEEGSTEIELKKALRKLYNQSLVIKKVSSEGIRFDAAGNLTESSVGPFLEKAYKEGKLPDEAFKSATCLKVKNIIEEKGFLTSQLFIIESTCAGKVESYILKEMAKKYDEAKPLARLQAVRELEEFILPHHVPGYPSIAIPIAFITYNNHYLSLMPKAPGMPYAQVMKTYVNNPTPHNEKLVKQAYSELGKSLGALHKKFMQPTSGKILGPTKIHQDLHHKNVFYNPSNHQVTLIDNERFFSEIKPITADIAIATFVSTEPHLIPSGMQKSLNKEQWYSLIIPAFFIGYTQVFPQAERKLVLQEIRNLLQQYSNKYSSIFNKYYTTIEMNI